MSVSVSYRFGKDIHSVTYDNVTIYLTIKNDTVNPITVTKLSYPGSSNYAPVEIPIEGFALKPQQSKETYITLSQYGKVNMETMPSSFPITISYTTNGSNKTKVSNISPYIKNFSKDLRDFAGEDLRIAVIGMKGATKSSFFNTLMAMLLGTGYQEIQATASTRDHTTLETLEAEIPPIGVTLMDTRGVTQTEFNASNLLNMIGYGTNGLKPAHYAFFFITADAAINMPGAWRNIFQEITKVFSNEKNNVRYTFVITQMDKISGDLVKDPNLGLKNPEGEIAKKIDKLKLDVSNALQIGPERITYTVNYFKDNIVSNSSNFEIERRAYILMREAMLGARYNKQYQDERSKMTKVKLPSGQTVVKKTFNFS